MLISTVNSEQSEATPDFKVSEGFFITDQASDIYNSNHNNLKIQSQNSETKTKSGTPITMAQSEMTQLESPAMSGYDCKNFLENSKKLKFENNSLPQPVKEFNYGGK